MDLLLAKEEQLAQVLAGSAGGSGAGAEGSDSGPQGAGAGPDSDPPGGADAARESALAEQLAAAEQERDEALDMLLAKEVGKLLSLTSSHVRDKSPSRSAPALLLAPRCPLQLSTCHMRRTTIMSLRIHLGDEHCV